jgi:hypothetical protein
MKQDKWPRYIFHGGCLGCTQQELHGVDFCVGCQCFDADWELPDLNNRPLTKSEEMRNHLKLVHGFPISGEMD